MLKSDSVLRDALPDAPTISLRKAPTLNDKLVKSHLALYNKKPDLPPEEVTTSVDIAVTVVI